MSDIDKEGQNQDGDKIKGAGMLDQVDKVMKFTDSMQDSFPMLKRA